MVRPITNDEIKKAMFDIGDDKALGPNGYTSAYTIGCDVCNAIRDLFGNGQLLKEINHTFLALIPKVTTPSKVNDYRPISCCNVIYKCIRIKEVVSENQSAFVPGRRISDNILITQELMHNYHRDKGPPSINGNIHGLFKGKRGLHQGDPLSPYLFTLVIEVLTLILQRRVRVSNTFLYHHHCEELQIINVCFVDDLFFFARGELDSVKLIMEALDEFKMVLGLVPSILKEELSIKYLGIPLISSRLLNRDCKLWVGKEGGLGLRSLEVFNLALMTTNLWNIASNKESLWVRWIHTYKLRGRTIWDIQPKSDMSWGWQLCEFVKPFFWVQIGNGLNTSLWYDRWCSLSPLSRFLSPRDITSEGYIIQTRVADLIVNDAWIWPQRWLAKAPNIGTIVTPNLNNAQPDCLRWRDINGNMLPFSVKCAWEVLRPRGIEVSFLGKGLPR
ncbi:hypothetical protein Tco_0194944 [Tanacetum coccineum]